MGAAAFPTSTPIAPWPYSLRQCASSPVDTLFVLAKGRRNRTAVATLSEPAAMTGAHRRAAEKAEQKAGFPP